MAFAATRIVTSFHPPTNSIVVSQYSIYSTQTKFLISIRMLMSLNSFYALL